MSYATGPKPYVYQETPPAQSPTALPSAQPVTFSAPTSQVPYNMPTPQNGYSGRPVAPQPGSSNYGKPMVSAPYQYIGPVDKPLRTQSVKPTPKGGWPKEPPYESGEPVFLGVSNGHEPFVDTCPRCNYEGMTVIK
jgi:hypothetical protein